MAKEQDAIPEGDDEVIDAPEADAPETQADKAEDDEPEPEPYAPLAEKLGWVPKDKFKGNASSWKTAEQYIIGTDEKRGETVKELKELRGTIDSIARTNSSLLAEKLAEERARTAQHYARAVDEGDPDAVWAATQRLNALDAAMRPLAPSAPPVSGEAVAWADKNRWFIDDPLAQHLAVQTAEVMARSGKGPAEQMAAAEREVRRVYPHHFSGQHQAPGVSEPGGRSAGPSNRGKTFEDMPREAQKVAKAMIERNPDKITKADYARNFWASEGKA